MALGASTLPTAPARGDSGPSADLWPVWQTHDPDATDRIDHTPLGTLLDRYRRMGPDGVARFAYGAVSTADKRRLDTYVKGLEQTRISRFARPEQEAYWINLYNALTLKVVLDHYPVDSIRDIDFGGLFTFGPWGEELLTIEGRPVSLDDIEHRILRPIWQDARIHYAVNCASIGCPDLAAEPFSAARMDAMMTAGARGYVAHPRGARVENRDSDRPRLIVSSIYEWFESDFVRAEGGVLAHLQHYASPDKARAIGRAGRVSDDAYDWSLNDAV
jgi:hypothetical protein